MFVSIGKKIIMRMLFNLLISPLAIQILLSIAISYFVVIIFNWYNLGSFSLKPRLQKSWFKILPLAIPFFLVVNALFQTDLSDEIDFSGYQNLPSYLMFFATVLSIYLLYRALTSERKASQLSAFENRFFKFMDYHRDNVSQMKYRDSDYEGERYWEGNQVFTIIYYEICQLLSNIEKKRPSITVQEKVENINLAFQCVFYGAGKKGISILEKSFSPDALEGIGFKDKRAAYYKDKKKSVNKRDVSYYSGHVRRLGHYFRNIYQMVKYVEGQEFLPPKKKYEYITHFRAQMSVNEQSVFFFNSLSTLGNVWEWEKYKRPLPNEEKERKKLFEKLLITKYDFVRNTLNNDGEIAEGVNIKAFYPLINLERMDESSICEILPFEGNYNKICRPCFNEKYIGYRDQNQEEEIIEHFSNASFKELQEFGCTIEGCKTKKQIVKILSKRKTEEDKVI